jgi:hypothetical protein
MHRMLLVSLLGCLASSAALAQEAKPQACILNATETLTAPRKPNLFRMLLDCGTAASTEAQGAVLAVNAKENTADALNHLLALGYEVEAASTRHTYSGNAIVTTFVLVKESGAAAATTMAPSAPTVPAMTPAVEGDGLEDAEELPEPSAEPAPESESF